MSTEIGEQEFGVNPIYLLCDLLQRHDSTVTGQWQEKDMKNNVSIPGFLLGQEFRQGRGCLVEED